MKRDRSPSIEEMFNLGLILPTGSDLQLELDHYRRCREFHSLDLEARRQLCPDLFAAGCNLIPDQAYFHLNRILGPRLHQEFPLVPFETQADLQRFLETPTFYLVERPARLEGEDLLGHDYSTLDRVLMRICPGDPLGRYELYSEGELLATLLQYQDFINPKWRPALFGSEEPELNRRLTPVEIARIEKLLPETLPDVISGIRNSTIHRRRTIDRLEPDDETKQLFYRLLYAGMRMRGWAGTGPYPLKSLDTSGPVDEVALIQLLMQLLEAPSRWLDLPLFNYLPPPRVVRTLNSSVGVDESSDPPEMPELEIPYIEIPDLERSDPLEVPELEIPYIEIHDLERSDPLEMSDPEIPYIEIPDLERSDPLEIPELEGQFDRLLQELLVETEALNSLDLPQGDFQISNNRQQGLTIQDRLLIVLKNEDDYACIRLSSNWLVSTAWYYLDLYFAIRPFPIGELAWIS